MEAAVICGKIGVGFCRIEYGVGRNSFADERLILHAKQLFFGKASLRRNPADVPEIIFTIFIGGGRKLLGNICFRTLLVYDQPLLLVNAVEGSNVVYADKI